MTEEFEEPLDPARPQGTLDLARTERLFEQKLHRDLHQFLQSMNETDARLPECPDVEEKWEQIAKGYIPDGIKEFFAEQSGKAERNRMGYHMTKMN